MALELTPEEHHRLQHHLKNMGQSKNQKNNALSEKKKDKIVAAYMEGGSLTYAKTRTRTGYVQVRNTLQERGIL